MGLKPHVLRYWEQEFEQLKPVKRRGNRRYYQRQDVVVDQAVMQLACMIRALLLQVPANGWWVSNAKQDEDEVTATNCLFVRLSVNSKKILAILKAS